MGKKIGRNDKCHCNSGKKYKKCCLQKDEDGRKEVLDLLEHGHEISSDKIQIVHDELSNRYPNHRVIDVTNILNKESYRDIQTFNYYRNTITLAERNEESEEVFSSRGPENVNMMVLYKGAYQCFEDINFQPAIDKICKMIDTRLNGEEYNRTD